MLEQVTDSTHRTPPPTSSFALPQNLVASEPREIHGLTRSDVRLLVIDRTNKKIIHSTFENLASFLRSGDLLVFNSSRTLPAALVGRDKIGKEIEVRLAEHLPDDSWLALLRGQGEHFYHGFEGNLIQFKDGFSCLVYSRDNRIPKLWKIRFSADGSKLMTLIYKLGRPIRYEYVPRAWSLDHYQNVYASRPGSSEMPSAGRAFTWKMIFNLKKLGIDTTDIVLHAGLSSYMDDKLDAQHPISEEEFFIRSAAARKINHTRAKGGRVIAVGTTVVRALESMTAHDGSVLSRHGYTTLHVTKDYNLRIVDGLLTGLHEPNASHLDLLQAFVSQDILHNSYNQAVKLGYLWHEFGDLNLII